MSKEKECESCKEKWYDSDIKNGLCPDCYDYFKQLKQQLEEKNKEIAELKEKQKQLKSQPKKVVDKIKEWAVEIPHLPTSKLNIWLVGENDFEYALKQAEKELKGE